ncbi:WbqC family protein [Myroides marinus]|uniref:WbqC-like protein family protein n=1 Tax=Myroides marinus TaxID=703342 RepID=A0A1H6SUF1_9FLAO|nr:WbqC family protein [Myroides marinus]MDM1346169.1 WbqC family protein [Myroides marinus]MDM1351156.1 WbqC family protein [Myroides marinus]MDM1353423.1 WbqC family protein [Myroides marinus]MDM1358328.1 WbqC family protein [Myroides marinus]MDM1362737.1 WbqC family protein [Myroides marinus]
MKIAIMQPYFLPYIGYFQLIKAVDKFVFYDDVNYIKQGWINRNNILLQGKASLFTIPLEKASSFTKINNVKLHPILFDNWKVKFLRSIEQNYRKAPYFSDVYQLICSILEVNSDRIGVLAKDSVITVSKYLQLETEFVYSSDFYMNNELSGKFRVISICAKENALVYINPIGGQELYNKEDFLSQGLDLYFIQSKKQIYQQFKEEFVPWLSIIDILMFNSVEEIQLMLDEYNLI